MKDKHEDAFDDRHDEWTDGKVGADERRILYAKWLDESWKEFFEEGGQAQVTKSFKLCGMLNVQGGSEDKEIKV